MNTKIRKTFSDYVSEKDLESLNSVDKEIFVNALKENIDKMDELFKHRNEMDESVFLRKRGVLYTNRVRLLSKYLHRTDYYERCKERNRGSARRCIIAPATPQRKARVRLYGFLSTHGLLNNYKRKEDRSSSNWFARWKKMNNSDGTISDVDKWIANKKLTLPMKKKSRNTPQDYGVSTFKLNRMPVDVSEKFYEKFNFLIEQKERREFSRQWMSVKINNLLKSFGLIK